MKKVVFLFYFSLFNFFSYSQNYQFSSLVQEDREINQILNDEVADVKVDTEGNLWVVTFSEIIRSDGKNHEVIASSHLGNYSYSKFNESKYLGDYINDIYGRLFFIESDSLVPYKYNHLIDSIVNGSFLLYSKFLADSALVIAASDKSMVFKISRGKVDTLAKFRGLTNMHMIESDSQFLYSYGEISGKVKDTVLVPNVYILIYNSKMEVVDSILSYSKNFISPAFIRQLKTGVTLFWNSKGSIIISKPNQDYQVFGFPYQLLNAFLDNKNNLWLSTRKNGVFIYPNYDLNFSQGKRLISFKNLIVSDQDKEGRIWGYIESKGVFKLPNINLERLELYDKKLDERIYNVVANNDYLGFSTKNEFARINKSQKKVEFQNYPKDVFVGRGGVDKRFYSMVLVEDDLIGGQRTTLWRVGSKGLKAIQIDSVLGGGERSLLLNEIINNSIYFAKETRVYKLNLFSNTTKLIHQYSKNITNILSGKELLYSSTEDSISLYDYDKGKIRSFYFPRKIRSWKMVNKRLWVTTTEAFGELLQLNDTIIFKPFKKIKNGSLAVESDTSIWIISDRANYNVLIPVDNDTSCSISIFSPFPKFKVTSLASDNEYLYIGTVAKGLLRISWNGLKSNSLNKSSIVLKTLKIKGETVEPSKPFYEISQPDNNIEIIFKDINHSEWPTNYRYRISDNDSWRYTDQNSVYLSNLEQGFYELEMQARRGNQPWTESKKMQIKIKPPIWKDWRYIAVLIFILLISTYLLIRRRIRNIQRRDWLIIEKLKAEQRFLKVQMNPHFIFNSLTSLKYLLVNNDTKKANHFVDKLGDIVRSIFDQGKLDKVSIKEEINFNREYLQLEQIRLENKFSYSFNVDDSLDQTIRIPNLLIQPILENAIHHGIKNKEGKGHIDINIELESSYLKVVIKDNGVGYQRSLRYKAKSSRNHSSEALKIIKDRIKLNNKVFRNQDFDIEDRNEMVEDSGTVVTLYLLVNS